MSRAVLQPTVCCIQYSKHRCGFSTITHFARASQQAHFTPMPHRNANEDELPVKRLKYPNPFKPELTVLCVRIANRETRRTRRQLEPRTISINTARLANERRPILDERYTTRDTARPRPTDFHILEIDPATRPVQSCGRSVNTHSLSIGRGSAFWSGNRRRGRCLLRLLRLRRRRLTHGRNRHPAMVDPQSQVRE